MIEYETTWEWEFTLVYLAEGPCVRVTLPADATQEDVRRELQRWLKSVLPVEPSRTEYRRGVARCLREMSDAELSEDDDEFLLSAEIVLPAYNEPACVDNAGHDWRRAQDFEGERCTRCGLQRHRAWRYEQWDLEEVARYHRDED